MYTNISSKTPHQKLEENANALLIAAVATLEDRKVEDVVQDKCV